MQGASIAGRGPYLGPHRACRAKSSMLQQLLLLGPAPSLLLSQAARTMPSVCSAFTFQSAAAAATASPALTAFKPFTASPPHRCHRLHPLSSLASLPCPLQRAPPAFHPSRPSSSRASSTATPATTTLPVPQPQLPPSSSPSIPTPKAQVVDFTTLAASCHEISAAWVPSKVEQVIMYGSTDVCVRLRNIQGTGFLHLSWHPVASRVCMSGPPPRGASAEAFTLGEQLNKELQGLVLVGVVMPQAWERVIQLQFGVRPGEPHSRSIYCEVMARYSNILLTDQGLQILACASQIGSAKSSLRLLQTGGQYQLPPVTSGVPPDASMSLEEWKSIVTRAAQLAAAAADEVQRQKQLKQASGGTVSGGAAADAEAGTDPSSGSGPSSSGSPSVPPERLRLVEGLTRAFNGVSPLLVEELCIRTGAGGPVPSSSPCSLSAEQWGALYEQWGVWLQCMKEGRFQATSDPDTGRFSVLGTFSSTHDSVQELLDDYYGALQAGELHTQLHQRLAAAVKAAMKRAASKARSFREQLGASEAVQEVQTQADMMTANIWRIQAGSAEVEVEDWETGEPLKLKLDPTKTPVEMAEAMYKKARKLRRAVQAVQPLLEAVQLELSYLEEVEASVAGLERYSEPDDLRALREVQEELVQQGYLKPRSDAALAVKGAAKGKKAAKRGNKEGAGAGAVEGGGFRMYTTPGGLQVLIGRNNRQNDELSNQVARPNDVWMHVRGMPGSHSIIRVPSAKSPVMPAEADLQFCADLTAFFSKAKAAGKVDVIVTLGQHLKKPKGAKPGQIMVTKELRNVVARPAMSAAAAAGELQ